MEMTAFRKFTTRLEAMVADGEFDIKTVLDAALGYMSEDDVKAMCQANDFSPHMFPEEDEDESNAIKESYEDGECPDCGHEIPDDVEEGDECDNCPHVFHEEREVVDTGVSVVGPRCVDGFPPNPLPSDDSRSDEDWFFHPND